MGCMERIKPQDAKQPTMAGFLRLEFHALLAGLKDHARAAEVKDWGKGRLVRIWICFV